MVSVQASGLASLLRPERFAGAHFKVSKIRTVALGALKIHIVSLQFLPSSEYFDIAPHTKARMTRTIQIAIVLARVLPVLSSKAVHSAAGTVHLIGEACEPEAGLRLWSGFFNCQPIPPSGQSFSLSRRWKFI